MKEMMIKILIVASDKGGHFVPFIEEQIAVLQKRGIEVFRFGITGHGILGYLRSLPALKRVLREQRPDIVHAHYGLSALLANLQRRVPVVSTYHGSDINVPSVLRFSKVAIRLSAWNIFVSERNVEIAAPTARYSLIPCGVDLTEVQLTDKEAARHRMDIPSSARYVLFAGSFTNDVKDPELAKQTMALLPEVELRELKGYTREQVNLLMCGADAFLMTSKTEGSPQVVKEAMACGCPIVSTDVGDVKERTEGINGCYVASSRDPQELASLLKKAMAFAKKTDGRKRIEEAGLSNEQIVDQLLNVYTTILNR